MTLTCHFHYVCCRLLMRPSCRHPSSRAPLHNKELLCILLKCLWLCHQGMWAACFFHPDAILMRKFLWLCSSCWFQPRPCWRWPKRRRPESFRMLLASPLWLRNTFSRRSSPEIPLTSWWCRFGRTQPRQRSSKPCQSIRYLSKFRWWGRNASEMTYE